MVRFLVCGCGCGKTKRMQHKVCNILPIPRRTLSCFEQERASPCGCGLNQLQQKTSAVSLPCCAASNVAQQGKLTALLHARGLSLSCLFSVF